jgi:hypothetical protein
MLGFIIKKWKVKGIALSFLENTYDLTKIVCTGIRVS